MYMITTIKQIIQWKTKEKYIKYTELLRNFFPLFLFTKFLKNILLIYFLERGREWKREGEKHQCVVASHATPTGDLAHNPGMYPDWESNWWPFGLQVATQSTEPHQPGLFTKIFIRNPDYFYNGEKS